MKQKIGITAIILLLLTILSVPAWSEVNLPHDMVTILTNELIGKSHTWTGAQTFTSGVTEPNLVAGESGVSITKLNVYNGLTVYGTDGNQIIYTSPTAANNRIGIGRSPGSVGSFTGILDVAGTGNIDTTLRIRGDSASAPTENAFIQITNQTGTEQALIGRYGGGVGSEYLILGAGSGIAMSGSITSPVSTSNLDLIISATNGNIGIGTTSFGNGAKALEFGSGTTPTVFNNPGFIALIVSGVSEMFAYDKAGTLTQLSAHDPETGDRYYYSFNVYTGRVQREVGGVKIDYVDQKMKVNPELSHKEDWTKQWVKQRCLSGLTPTQVEIDTAVANDFKFNWQTMPKFVRRAWGKE